MKTKPIKVQIEIIKEHPSLVVGKIYSVRPKSAKQMIQSGMAIRYFPPAKPEEEIVKPTAEAVKIETDDKQESTTGSGNKSGGSSTGRSKSRGSKGGTKKRTTKKRSTQKGKKATGQKG